MNTCSTTPASSNQTHNGARIELNLEQGTIGLDPL